MGIFTHALVGMVDHSAFITRQRQSIVATRFPDEMACTIIGTAYSSDVISG